MARGLIAAGIAPGDRVALMSRTRYEWTLLDYAIWAAGAVTVPIYETSSAEQAAWILADSGAVAVRGGDRPPTPTLVAGVRDRLPELRDVWQIDLDGGRRSSSPPARRSTPAEIEQRRSAVARRRPRHDHLHQRHHRPAQGLRADPPQHVRRHRQRACRCCRTCSAEGASTLLFLPLAHAFARLIQVGVVQARATMAHCADTSDLVAELQAFQPTFVLSVPRVFEKVYNARPAEGRGRRQGRDLRPGRAGRHRLQRGAGDPAGPGPGAARPARALRPAGLPQAARRARRPVPRRDLRRRAARRPARPLLPRHRGDHLRGVRPDRDLAGRRGEPAHRHRGSARSAGRCPASPSGSPTTARS